MQDSDRTQLFDRWAEHYDATVTGGGDAFPFAGYEQVLDAAVDLAAVQPGLRILDLGIGTGNLAARFLELGCEVWGMDFSAEMLAQARAKWPELHLIEADLRAEWPVAVPRPFERVVSAYVLHEFDLVTKVAILQRAVEFLAPDGWILIADIAFPTVAVRSAAAQQWAEWWDPEEHYWAADETRVACEAVGLQVRYQQVSPCGGVFTFTRPRTKR